MSEIEDAPKVILGGKEWPVPLLAARQNRIIDPLILSLLPVFTEWQHDRAGAVAKIRNESYDALQEITYQAITRATPTMTRGAFLDMPVTLPELIGAFPLIAQQTGVFARSTPGEAMAGKSPPNSQTGIE